MEFQHLYGYIAIGIGLIIGIPLGYFTGIPWLGAAGAWLGAVGFDIFLRLHSHEEDRWMRGEEGADFYEIPVWLLCTAIPIVFFVMDLLGIL